LATYAKNFFFHSTRGTFIAEPIDSNRSRWFNDVKGNLFDKLLKLKASGKIEEGNIVTTIGANIAVGSDTNRNHFECYHLFFGQEQEKEKELREVINKHVKLGNISTPVTVHEC
jgi:hypothetical protein